jgi:hypothetical protein
MINVRSELSDPHKTASYTESSNFVRSSFAVPIGRAR